jgi:putative SOS response-associated peptidase YedK
LGVYKVSSNPPQRRDYKKEARYEDTPAQIKHREERNQLRAEEAKKLGRAPVGDVAHIRPLESGGVNTLSNARVESVAKNRSWRKGQKKYTVPVDK